MCVECFLIIYVDVFAFRQVVTEKQKEFSDKLDELYDSLTLTENRLIGHQQEAGQTDRLDSVSDLQQYQQEHQVCRTETMGPYSPSHHFASILGF